MHTRSRYAVAAVLCLVALALQAGTVLIPDSLTITNVRQEAVCALSSEFYKGQPLRLTNCLVRTTGSTPQALSNVTVIVRVGLSGNYATATGTVQSVTGGVWSATVTLPDIAGDQAAIEVRLVDSQTNTFVYPRKLLYLTESL